MFPVSSVSRSLRNNLSPRHPPRRLFLATRISLRRPARCSPPPVNYSELLMARQRRFCLITMPRVLLVIEEAPANRARRLSYWQCLLMSFVPHFPLRIRRGSSEIFPSRLSLSGCSRGSARVRRGRGAGATSLPIARSLVRDSCEPPTRAIIDVRQEHSPDEEISHRRAYFRHV